MVVLKVSFTFLLLMFSFPSSVYGQDSKNHFFWGVANAAFQVEGSPGESDWLEWTRTAGKIADGTNADRATDFWVKYDEDFALAQELGSNSFRISIAWERIEPQPGQWNEEALNHYEKIILAMRARGLEPVVTLHHFVLPLWISKQGGVFAKDFVNEFADYAEKVVARLSLGPASVRYWMTFNEPIIMLMGGYLDGEWPPGQKGQMASVLKGTGHLASAHRAATLKIRKANPLAQVSVAMHWRDFQPAADRHVDKIATRTLDWLFNRRFLNHITGRKDPSGRPFLDYLGINYYGRTIVGAIARPPFYETKDGDGPKTDVGWEVYPQGLYNVIKQASSYKLPIIISENGAADKDDKLRGDFLREHLSYLMKAKADGHNVMGYLYWSLTDNFEWAKGLAPRFGLIEMDYARGERRRRASFYIYKDLIHQYSKP